MQMRSAALMSDEKLNEYLLVIASFSLEEILESINYVDPLDLWCDPHSTSTGQPLSTVAQ